MIRLASRTLGIAGFAKATPISSSLASARCSVQCRSVWWKYRTSAALSGGGGGRFRIGNDIVKDCIARRGRRSEFEITLLKSPADRHPEHTREGSRLAESRSGL